MTLTNKGLLLNKMQYYINKGSNKILFTNKVMRIFISLFLSILAVIELVFLLNFEFFLF